MLCKNAFKNRLNRIKPAQLPVVYSVLYVCSEYAPVRELVQCNFCKFSFDCNGRVWIDAWSVAVSVLQSLQMLHQSRVHTRACKFLRKKDKDAEFCFGTSWKIQIRQILAHKHTYSLFHMIPQETLHSRPLASIFIFNLCCVRAERLFSRIQQNCWFMHVRCGEDEDGK